MVGVDFDQAYLRAEDVVTREIEGELFLVPVTAEIGGGDELFTFNETGRAVWSLLDGKETLRHIVDGLAAEYDAPLAAIEQDVRGLMTELLERKLVVARSR